MLRAFFHTETPAERQLRQALGVCRLTRLTLSANHAGQGITQNPLAQGFTIAGQAAPPDCSGDISQVGLECVPVLCEYFTKSVCFQSNFRA